MTAGCSTTDTLSDEIEPQIEKTAEFLSEQIPNPQVASVGGEWTVKGLKSSRAYEDEKYFDRYYDNVRAIVKSQDGKLHERYYTEYARVTIGLCAIGKDPRNVEGYDLTVPLDDYDMITAQGPNAAAYALTAANTAGVTLKNQDRYIEYLISEIDNGAVKEDRFYSDYISMALLGLSFYADREEVKETIERYTDMLSEMQDENGSLGSCESDAEAVMALSQLGIDVTGDDRFVKKGGSFVDAIMEYSLDDGSFCHSLERKETDFMATEKALIALDSIKLYKEGKKLY